MPLSRRELFRLCGGAALAMYLPACGDNAQSTIFSNEELAALRAFANVIIPKDDEPGGVELGAVQFIEALIKAFDQPTPAIFANGPFSDRNPFPNPSGQPGSVLPENDFASFVELDRVAEFAWRLQIFGSAGVPGGAPNEALLGPVIGLEEQIVSGLRAAIAQANGSIGDLSQDQRTELFNSQPDELKALMIELVTEAAFAAPEYGGNIGLAGWRLCNFEGDAQPLGYSQYTPQGYVERAEAPVSTANPGADPAPLSGEVADLIALVVTVLGGRVRP
jgi:hypothetical protein